MPPVISFMASRCSSCGFGDGLGSRRPESDLRAFRGRRCSNKPGSMRARGAPAPSPFTSTSTKSAPARPTARLVLQSSCTACSRPPICCACLTIDARLPRPLNTCMSSFEPTSSDSPRRRTLYVCGRRLLTCSPFTLCSSVPDRHLGVEQFRLLGEPADAASIAFRAAASTWGRTASAVAEPPAAGPSDTANSSRIGLPEHFLQALFQLLRRCPRPQQIVLP